MKCFRCAELEGCYKGKNGGKEKCECFCPRVAETGKRKLVLVHYPNWEQLIDINNDNEILCENHNLDAESILNCLGIDYISTMRHGDVLAD